MAGYREYRLRVYESRTLKDKRAVRRSMLARIRNKFHAACAEIDTQDNVGILTIGIAVVSNSTTQIGKMLDEIESLILSSYNVDIMDSQTEMV